MTLRITGDVHGMTEQYVLDVQESACEHSLQIGDMGFHYEDLLELDSKNHKFIGGNHDNYDVYDRCPHALGNFGKQSLGGLDFYYIRGAFSIDWKDRIVREMQTSRKSWWKQEQLNREQQEAALKDYCAAKPSVMITHSCPTSIAKHIGNPGVLISWGYDADTFNTDTQQLLQDCLDCHKPDVWIFGHFHRTLDFKLNGTRFICLGELRAIEYKDGKFYNENRLDSVRQR